MISDVSSLQMQWCPLPPQSESTATEPTRRSFLCKLQWPAAADSRVYVLTLTSGRGQPWPGGVARDGQPMQQQRRFAANRPGGYQHHAYLCEGGVVRSRGEEVHLGREEDLLPLRHLWPLVHHLALDHRAQCKKRLFVLWMFVRC